MGCFRFCPRSGPSVSSRNRVLCSQQTWRKTPSAAQTPPLGYAPVRRYRDGAVVDGVVVSAGTALGPVAPETAGVVTAAPGTSWDRHARARGFGSSRRSGLGARY